LPEAVAAIQRGPMFALLRAFFLWLLPLFRPTRLPRGQRSRRSEPRALLQREPARREPDRRGLSIEYAPERDGEADPGEVVWTWVPYEDDPTQG